MMCKCCGLEKPDEKSRGKQCRDCINKKISEYQKKNRKKCTEAHLKWVKANPEAHKEACNRWRKKNKEKYNEYHKLYARKRAAQKKAEQSE